MIAAVAAGSTDAVVDASPGLKYGLIQRSMMGLAGNGGKLVVVGLKTLFNPLSLVEDDPADDPDGDNESITPPALRDSPSPLISNVIVVLADEEEEEGGGWSSRFSEEANKSLLVVLVLDEWSWLLLLLLMLPPVLLGNESIQFLLVIQ